MYKNHRVSLCLPCRNEASYLRQTVARVPKWVDEIIVVSNRSTDNTVAIAKRLPRVRVIEDNRQIGGIGYGFAHMTAIKNATGDLIAGADGDATYPVEDLDKVLDFMITNNLDFVSCARYPLQGIIKIPFKLRLGVKLLNWEVRLLYGLAIKDTLSGMWIFRSSIKETLQLKMGNWNLSPEIKLNAATNPKIKFAEYGIAQRQNRYGKSHQAYFKTGLSHLGFIFWHRLNLK